MKRFVWRCLAASSVIVGVLASTLGANGETRPQYGGTLRVAMRAAPASLDPADNSQPDSFARRSLMLLMFETMVALDDNGRTQPGLAASWQASADNQRWQFRLRRGVRFHDGTLLTPEVAAASLRTANPSWKVTADTDSVVIEREGRDTQLLAELALSRNAIARRTSDSRPIGTGPFHMADWQPGKKLTLAAEEGYWRGRPYLDGIEIEMGKSYRDQMTALELGKTDMVEVAADQAHRASLEGRRLANSRPMELLALVFAHDAKTPEENSLREALALSVERGSIGSVLLQGAGQPAAAILPNWMSGYGFAFSAEADLSRARHLREQVRTIPLWTLGYDGSDAVARLIAERIALNARDAGLTLQPTATATADVALARISLLSSDPRVALADVATRAGFNAGTKEDGSVQELYSSERAALATQRIIPLFHLPVSYAASSTLKNWSVRSDGSLILVDASLGNLKP
jgi:peptide/nickel transport system substrate-binding protein